ncbi:MAG: Nif3-like dinuclear metal center hexameric protein [Desulfobacteraceae bacterium]|nr:MAG: Nif3-like dinuclear metal center hexameric protein [Desulfobacteraceae bacterium]
MEPMTIVNDIIALMESVAPQSLAESWDNSGLQCGSRTWPVKHIVVALDPSLSVVKTACEKKADLLITHHPLIFQAIKNIILDSPVGEIIDLSIRNRLAIFSAHTNLDSVKGGLNDLFAEKLGLRNLNFLEPATEIADGAHLLHAIEGQHGLGRVGELASPSSLGALAETIKKTFGLATLKISGSLNMPVKKIAVCTGSGSGLMKQFLSTDADVYVSGDLKFHDAKDVETHHRALIDVGHFASEQLMIDLIAGRLATRFKEKDLDVTVEALRVESDPFQYI